MAVEITDRASAHLFLCLETHEGSSLVDVEAGMAKAASCARVRLAAPTTVANHAATALRWSIASARVLCDARILNIFEGAAENPGAGHFSRRLLGCVTAGLMANTVGPLFAPTCSNHPLLLMAALNKPVASRD